MVAMVTNTVERGQHKCEQYWPDERTKEYGPFKVTLAEQQVFADYTIRQLFVSVSFVMSLGRGGSRGFTQTPLLASKRFYVYCLAVHFKCFTVCK